MSDTRADGEPQCVSSPRATGADIPEELFEQILWYITDGDSYTMEENKEMHPPSKHPRVHTFASLIIVCRYFARICRPTLYFRVVLRNRHQLKGLLDLLDSRCAPCGEPLLKFTRDFSIRYDPDNSLWIHSLGVTLCPRLKTAGIVLPHLEIVSASPSIGRKTSLATSYAHLPRTLPCSLFQYTSQLYLRNAYFNCGEEFFRYLSSFHSLRSLYLQECTCEIVTSQRIFLRRLHRLPFPKTLLYRSDSLFPVMVSGLLEWYARETSSPYLLHGQAEVQLVADIMAAFSDRLTYRMFCSMYSDTSHIFSDPRPSIVVKFRYGPPSETSNLVWLTLVLRDMTHYDIMIRDNTRNAGGASKVLPGLVDCITLLPHLETLRWIFCDVGATSDFVDTSYSNLQRMHSAGQEMKVGYATTVDEEPSDWEPMASILRRFAPKMNVLAEEQASEPTAQEATNGPETDGGDSTEST